MLERTDVRMCLERPYGVLDECFVEQNIDAQCDNIGTVRPVERFFLSAAKAEVLVPCDKVVLRVFTFYYRPVVG